MRIFLDKMNNINFINDLQAKLMVDRNAEILLQFEVRHTYCLK